MQASASSDLTWWRALTVYFCTEPLRFHHGRKLLNTFYTESDPQHPDSHLVLVDTADASKPYTTEAQQIKDAQDAQVEHVEAAAVDSTPASASAVSRSPAADAQAGAINPRMTAEDDNSSSTDGAHLFGLKSDVSDMAQKAADGITDLKHSIADKFHSSESPPVESGTAAVAGHSQVFQAAAHTAAVTSSDAIGGPITLYNPYQSSTYNAWTNPAEAAIDGNILTSSQTAVDTASCKALNDQGQYGVCGLMSECTASPYFTGAYASTPSNPYWTAGFSSDISANYQVTQVVLTNRQECCRCPLAGAKIYIGNPSNLNILATDNPDLSKEITWQLCATVPEFSVDSPAPIFSEASKYTETFLCSQSLVGKAVAVQLPTSTTILSLAEVQVVGRQI
ncbi:hypothetical protein ABBQ38_013117 [Trebouxia sp. C0009 RCD-2024]